MGLKEVEVECDVLELVMAVNENLELRVWTTTRVSLFKEIGK